MFTVVPTQRATAHCCAAMHLVCSVSSAAFGGPPERTLGRQPMQLSVEQFTMMCTGCAMGADSVRTPVYSPAAPTATRTFWIQACCPAPATKTTAALTVVNAVLEMWRCERAASPLRVRYSGRRSSSASAVASARPRRVSAGTARVACVPAAASNVTTRTSPRSRRGSCCRRGSVRLLACIDKKRERAHASMGAAEKLALRARFHAAAPSGHTRAWGRPRNSRSALVFARRHRAGTREHGGGREGAPRSFSRGGTERAHASMGAAEKALRAPHASGRAGTREHGGGREGAARAARERPSGHRYHDDTTRRGVVGHAHVRVVRG